ncbi:MULTISPECIES: glycosyltransferase family 4 protein [Brevibacillus]|jgi:UDP-GlcNAc:undecaprenyl-phosphate GlcNAc-1-phosphate transferase|uniref:UDP-N-acetylmuramyl pentapeptide n=1 Tax=Brevibacillus borstelensis AK1 TaxID=1300222 RepID=M8DFS0_9BACL|nr:MraY family glycosyltransferase [Brevibacillus borstelensis]EMT52292.1 UDP-N-acetylmuramyl pentapeptide [Brevibacillus borstelensis AK1]KKX54736.1 UDP-phosphate N-acetylglucosaminyl 1-phosphate transferase [Brevibacillus borstelensis cifa_chp40]MBE5395050.1 undecaprenyl/decaprenyl-phosphate alpha-N-acetylglucosaminyl 1-phosphate transferase [Brevibacillus borstelensis]MCC0566752.1 undecaprenyl/decaprenyl-phosphate alpha-N-acetylglucosaminyl 1-phosphate transferase [Brevibacillus borstelensis
MSTLILGLLTSLIVSFIATPYVKKLAESIGATDTPDQRKVHKRIMPRLGGLAIYLGYFVAFFIFVPFTTMKEMLGIFIGGTIVMATGMLDDKYQLSPKWKLMGQLLAAAVVVIPFGLKIGVVNLPYEGSIDFSSGWLLWLGVPITIFWIVGVTNAVNLIDGLDGLSAGVSAIATATMAIVALVMSGSGAAAHYDTIAIYCFVLLGAILGFLYFNFHPARIFMGDTGSLFLGFNLAALSIMGFKEALFVSFIIPIVVLGVPLWDTFFAIVRRIVNKKPISSPDKGHLHHCLLNMGLSHRATVLTIYMISIFFGTMAIVLTKTTKWTTIIVMVLLLFATHMATEIVGLVGRRHRPLINTYRKLKVKNADQRRSH